MAANWQALRERHGGRDVAAVLKADAYGLGAGVLSRRLHDAGCRHVFTAHPEEALALRPLLPDTMVGVLNGLWPGEAAAYAAGGVLPVLGSLGEIAQWQTQAVRLGRALPALLHVDTGMNRLGMDAREWRVLLDDPGRLDGISLRYVLTHLAAADTAHDPASLRQRDAFEAACDALDAARTRAKDACPSRIPRSLANSSGLFLGDAFASDLARPGAALFGLNPVPGRPNPMRPVLRLSARVLSVREVPAGCGVGYNAAWIAPRASRIATVAVGYADGYLRALGNRGMACFDGKAVALVGRVSMDLTTFDVTDHPAVGVGSWLELIGPQVPPDALAEACGTNGYEILTSLGTRFERRYCPL